MERVIALSTDRWETQMALLEDGILQEYHLERQTDQRTVGNIYKGKVTSVLSGIQAAFVDIGEDRNGFLYVGELPSLPANVEGEQEGEAKRKFGFLSRRYRKPEVGIEQRLQKGDDVLVQVTKDAIGKKGRRLSTHLSLPGRFLVFMPHITKVGVSKRIPDAKERQRLREFARKISPSRMGLIVRTAGDGKSREDLKRDMKYLWKLWGSIKQQAKEAASPHLIHKDLDLKLRVVRDFLTQDVTRVVVDSPQAYEELVAFCKDVAPDLVGRIQRHESQDPLFDALNVSPQVESVLLKRVPLNSGGHMVIEQTEALTSIDINSGSSVDQKNLEETALRTNLEAAEEVIRQIRLRNLGGLIIIDFIDMTQPDNRRKLMRHLHQAARKDKAPWNITEMSDMGLVEMTRKRDKRSLQRSIDSACHYCSGTGRLKSLQTMSINIQRRLLAIITGQNTRRVLVKAHPDVAHRLLNDDRQSLADLEREARASIVVEPDEGLHREEAKFFSVESMQLIEAIKTPKPLRTRKTRSKKPQSPRKKSRRKGPRRGPRNQNQGEKRP